MADYSFMALFYPLSLGLISWLGIIAVLAVSLLFYYIAFAYADACSLFQYAQSMKGLTRCSRYHAVVGPPKDVCDPFAEDTHYSPYNVYLHMIRFFSIDHRLRGAQVINVLFLVATGGCFTFLLYDSLADILSGEKARISVALLFAMMVMARTKLVLVALAAYSEVINYFLLVVAALIFTFLLAEPSVVMALVLGAVCGLSYRNRPTEGILLLAVLLSCLYMGLRQFALVVLMAFVVMVGDILWHFVRKNSEQGWGYLRFAWVAYGKNNGEEKGEGGSLVSRFVAGVGRFFALSKWDSAWPSLGSSLLLFPLSLWVMAHEYLPPVCFFFLSYFILYSLAFCVLRQNIPGKGGEQFYFGSRPFYLAFFPVLFCNGIAFSFCLARNDTVLLCGYLFWIILYGIHQSYKVADYYFSDSIHETGNAVVDKVQQSFRKELCNYMLRHSSTGRMVMLGYYLIWGEAYNFFHCHRNLRCVSLLRPVDDTELLEWIVTYGVTHIALTPMSAYVGSGCSLRQKKLGGLLKGILEPEYVSEDLTIFHVNEQKRCLA